MLQSSFHISRDASEDHLMKTEKYQNSKSSTDQEQADSCLSLENKIFYSSIKLYFTVVFTK